MGEEMGSPTKCYRLRIWNLDQEMGLYSIQQKCRSNCFPNHCAGLISRRRANSYKLRREYGPGWWFRRWKLRKTRYVSAKWIIPFAILWTNCDDWTSKKKINLTIWWMQQNFHWSKFPKKASINTWRKELYLKTVREEILRQFKVKASLTCAYRRETILL